MTRQFKHHLPAACLLLILAAIYTAHILTPPEGWALGTYDMRGLFYPWWETARNGLFRGEIPWWDAGQLGGNPFLHNPQIAFFYPLTWIAIGLPLNIGISAYAFVHLWLAGLGMYLFTEKRGETREEKREEIQEQRELYARGGRFSFLSSLFSPFSPLSLPALLAALTFMFSGFFVARLFAGHSGLFAVHIWLTWLLWGSERALKNSSFKWAGFSGVIFGLVILAGHVTSVVYIGLIWALFCLYLAIFESDTPLSQRANRLSQSAIFLLIPLLGLIMSAVQLLPTLQLISLAGRTGQGGFEFATDFSFPPAHLMTLLVPEFFGEPTRAGYWSVPNFEELVAYAGLLPLLALGLLILKPTKRSWFWVFLIVLGTLLAFGRYGFLYRIVYNWFPPFRVMRAPGRAMFFYMFAAAALLPELFRILSTAANRGKIRQRLSWVMIGSLLLGLAAAAAIGAVFAAQHPTDTSGRLWHQLGGWLWATLGIVISAALLRWYIGEDESPNGPSDSGPSVIRHSALRHAVIGLALIGFILTDLWTFGYKLLAVENMTPDIVWLEARDLIDQDRDLRVLPWGLTIFEQNGASQVGLNSVFGYNTLELSNLTDMTNAAAEPTSKIYDVLSVGYVIANVSLNQYLEGEDPFVLAYRGEQTRIYRRPHTLPYARLVSGFEIIEEKGPALARLQSAEFNPQTHVILDQAPLCPLENRPADHPEVEILERSSGRWLLETNSPEPSMLVLSEIAFPGWQVLVDGETAEWQTAYTGLRAVCLSPGEHMVEWRFQPRIFWLGGGISLLGLLAALWLWIKH